MLIDLSSCVWHVCVCVFINAYLLNRLGTTLNMIWLFHIDITFLPFTDISLWYFLRYRFSNVKRSAVL